MARASGSYQNLGDGVYRVGGMSRSAITGRYVSNGAALRQPRTTISERQESAPSEGATRPR